MFKRVSNFIGKKTKRVKNWFRKLYLRLTTFMKSKPFLSFILVLVIILGILILGNLSTYLSKPEEEKEVIVKEVEVFSNSDAPTVRLQAKIINSGVIQIFAQTSGVVQAVRVKEGDSISRGQAIVNLSTNYQGGNISGLQYALASRQYKNVVDTFDTQKSIINDSRQIAEKTKENSNLQREIASDSASDTQSLIESNNSLINDLNQQIAYLESTNVNGANDQLIAQAKSSKAQIEASNYQLEAALRNLNLQKDENKPPAQIANLSKDLSLKQLEIQEKALDLNKDISRIQMNIAGVQASLMNPASPSQGTVERVLVTEGQLVNPGTLIAVIKSSSQDLTAEALAPLNISSIVSRSTYSTFVLDDSTYSALPTFISSTPTSGQLYSILYTIPSENSGKITNGQFVTVLVPIGDKISKPINYIPVDAVYQSQTDSYVYLVKDGKAVSRSIELGNLFGSYVQVKSGLNPDDKIILNRNVVSGDSVRVTSSTTVDVNEAEF